MMTTLRVSLMIWIAVRLLDSDFDALLKAAAKTTLNHRGHREHWVNLRHFFSSLLLLSLTGASLGGFRFCWRLRLRPRDLGQFRGDGALDPEQSAMVGQHFGSAVE